jgi:hypothetical protein
LGRLSKNSELGARSAGLSRNTHLRISSGSFVKLYVEASVGREASVNFLEQQPKLHVLSFRSWMLKVHGDLLRIHWKVVRWSAYSPEKLTNLEKMVIVLEDRRFPIHPGVDWRSVLREMVRALTFRRHGGASTIDMQFVRTVTGYRNKTLRRKAYEVLLAFLIQYRYRKIEILRSYLACAFFGSHLIGAKRAAMKVFGTAYPDNLDLAQAAYIAAMLVYPRPKIETELWRVKVSRRANYGMMIYLANKKRYDQFPS